MRLIDADNLAAKIMVDAPGYLDGGSEITKAFVLAMVKTRSVTPTIDAVPVVRCKDCKWRGTNACFCKARDDVQDNWFCSEGERQEGR